MNNFNRRLQKLEDQKRASSGVCLIIVEEGETLAEAKKRIGFDPETPCVLIIRNSSDAALL